MRWFLLIFPLMLFSCQKEEEAYVAGLGFDEFVPVFNEYMKTWNAEQLQVARDELAKVEADTPAAKDAEMKVARFERRIALGDYYSFKTPADLPADLEWKDGLNEPEDSDPAAKKAGCFGIKSQVSHRHCGHSVPPPTAA